jgi:ligand-binding sensor domain-containing protein
MHPCLAVACLLVGRAQALDPSAHISQYAHTAWRIQDGFFTGTPTAITQTKDGSLWIGTANGLFSYDGVRFAPWSASQGKKLLSAEVFAILGARDGSLWIGAVYGLFCWRNGELTEYPALDSMVTSIVERRNKTIWISRARSGDKNGPICEVTGRKLKCYGVKEGVVVPYAGALLEDANGDLWIGSSASSSLVRWRPGLFKSYLLKGLEQSKGLHGVEGLAEDPDGSLWVGLNYPGRGLGLQQLRGDTWKSFFSPALNGTSLSISSLLVDRNKALWVGTVDKGLYRISAGKVDHFDSADGLSSDTVTALFQDHEGSMWIATSKGIDSFRSMAVVTFSKREGLHSDGVRSVLPALDDAIWIANVGSLDALRGGVVSSILSRNGLPGREVTSLAQDRVGRLWVGISTTLYSSTMAIALSRSRCEARDASHNY